MGKQEPTTAPELPVIPIKIVRKDNKIKFTVGKYSLELKELPDRSQAYNFIAVEQFLTQSAQLIYGDLVKKEQIKKDIRAAFEGGAEEQNDQEFVKTLLNS